MKTSEGDPYLIYSLLLIHVGNSLCLTGAIHTLLSVSLFHGRSALREGSSLSSLSSSYFSLISFMYAGLIMPSIKKKKKSRCGILSPRDCLGTYLLQCLLEKN
uniref:Uncharacterized protein n=1 Tax=Lepeophtheirus salmonis TaxID=72036 RepID=A0A0K2VEQ3_LEPSM